MDLNAILCHNEITLAKFFNVVGKMKCHDIRLAQYTMPLGKSCIEGTTLLSISIIYYTILHACMS